jgi:hypothetical protein
LPYNGQYSITVSVAGSQHPSVLESCDGSCQQTGVTTTVVGVAVPPSSPKTVLTSVDAASHAVSVTWARNSELDIVGYTLQRKGPTDADYRALAQVAQSAPNQRVMYTDTSTAQAGGSYTYQVFAVRNGEDPSKYLVSDPTTTSATVDGPTATTAAGSGGSAPGGQVAAPGRPPILVQSGTVDASKFSVLQSQTKIPTNPPATPPPTEPDNGFNQALPFRKATTATTKADADGSAFPAVVHASTTDNRKTLLVTLAFAGIVFALAFHVRFLMRRIDQAG